MKISCHEHSQGVKIRLSFDMLWYMKFPHLRDFIFCVVRADVYHLL